VYNVTGIVGIAIDIVVKQTYEKVQENKCQQDIDVVLVAAKMAF